MWPLITLFSTIAGAQTEELAYLWNDHASVRYHFQSQISTPKGFRVYGESNVDARLLGLTISMDTTCTPSPLGKGWELTCTVDEVSLTGLGFDNEMETVTTILGEFEGLLESSEIQIELRRDGHLRTVDIEGPPKGTKRQSYRHEQMRQIMRRVFSPLSVQMPKKPDAWSKDWKHKGMHASFELMSTYGTAGGTRFDYEVVEWKESVAFIVGSGRGIVGTNLEMEAGSGSDADGNVYGSSTNPSISMRSASQTRFDSAQGLIVYSELAANGESTAQSMNVGGTARYAYGGWVGMIHEDGSMEMLDGRTETAREEPKSVPPVQEGTESEPDAESTPEVVPAPVEP